MSNGMDLRDGRLVSQRVAQVIDAIREYSPEIDVKWLPPEARQPNQAAFQIWHNPPGQSPYCFMHVKTEDEMNASVLQRIIAGDQRNGKITYSELEAAEEAAKRVAFQKWQDERDEAIDVMQHILKTPLNTYKVSDDLIIKEGIPFNVAKGRNK